ncbi:C40 family peptidase [Pelistega ratti]|uniref:C40 family peptidase n=1 Tax=Pelistega ratti TaxID=2652177 RepID=UPI00135983D3|nr:C40 family peptidase [Pelistega ratti]
MRFISSLTQRLSVPARYFLIGSIITFPTIWSTSYAQNIDPIGQFLSATDTSDAQWSVQVSDPIGNLINQAKIDRLNKDASISVSDSSNSSTLAQAALNYVGVRYRFGGATPKGFDCSGLIYYTANKYMGIELPRTSASMAKVGESVTRDDLQPGDLVFFNTRGFRNSHVGIYLGDNKFLHAPRTGKPVQVEKIAGYWDKRFNGARRLTAKASSLAQH